MTKLEKLLAELCPNGVVYRNFSDVAEYVRGVTYGKGDELKKNTKGGIMILRANNITLGCNALNFDDVKYISTSVKVKETQYLRKGDILICAGSGSKEHVGKVAFVSEDIPYAFGGFMAAIRTRSNNLLSRYLFHILTSTSFRTHIGFTIDSSTINNLNAKVISDFQVPVPPLEVQAEIVRILDNFTELTTELTTELITELTARKKQYEYYRDELLSFSDGECEWQTLETVAEIYDCPHSSPKWQEQGIPVIRNYNLVNGHIECQRLSYVDEQSYKDRTKRVVPQKDDILFSREAPIGNIGLVPDNFKCCQGQRIVLLRFDNTVLLSKFIIHLFQSDVIKKQYQIIQGQGATVSNFGIGELRKLMLPIPPIDRQAQLVSILDRFDALCSEITDGLPAEIEARNKQYEYYRDYLLSFKELRSK